MVRYLLVWGVEMYPVKFDAANRVLSPPEDWDVDKYGMCSDLYIQTEDGICKSCWRLSFVEAVKLIFKRKIYLSIVSGVTQPPVKLELR